MNRKIFLEGDQKAFLGALTEEQIKVMNAGRYAPTTPKLELFCGAYDVSQLFSNLVWSGEKSEVARKLEFSLVSNDAYYSPKFELKLHDKVAFFVDEQEVFYGFIIDMDRSLSERLVTYTALDGAFFLLKSHGAYQFEGVTPQDVVKKVAEEVRLETAKVETAEAYDRFHDDDSLYDVLMTGYTIASEKTGVQYYLRMDHNQVNVLRKGDVAYRYMLTGENEIATARFASSSEDAINRVKAYDENGTEVGVFKADQGDDFLGVLQAVYKAEGGSDVESGAKAKLRGVELKVSVEALGAVECTTGKAVVIKEPVTGLDGLFYIDGDAHSFSGGRYKMSLDLAFENIMDKRMAGSDKKESGDGDASFLAEGDSNAARAWNFLRAKGYSAAAVAGILGSLEAESGIDPKILQNGVGPGTGIAQWENPGRWPLLVNWAKAKGADPWALETQLGFLVYELEGGEATTVSILKSRYGGIQAFKNATDVKWATDAFYNSFERGSIHRMNVRYASAQKYHGMWKDQVKVSSGGRGTGKLIWPTPGYTQIPYEGYYGARRSEYGPHSGIDIIAPTGAKIIAADGGRVISAGWVHSYGNYIQIDHGGGLHTAYAHLSGYACRAGANVSKGQLIGYVGNTGDSTGSHLHFEVRKGGASRNFTVDPLKGWVSKG